MSDEPLTAEEILCLEEDAIFLPPPPGSNPGKRQLLSEYPISEKKTICVDFPVEEESAAVLEYLGFEASTASEIFERSARRPDPENCPDDLMSYACGQIAALKTSRYLGLDSKEAMSQVGLNQEIQNAITDPAFSDILWTRDLHYWVKDTIEINYATLRSRQELFKRHAGHRITHKSEHNKRASVQGLFSEEASASETSEPTAPDVTTTINMTTQDFHLPPNHAALLDDDVAARPNHTVLYKGKAYWDMRGSQRLIRDDGSIGMSTLSTSPGGDFNSTFNAHYWTPEKETAERHREWAARRCARSDTCVIQIQVSDAFLERLRIADIWYSSDWKEFVWNCRRELDSPSKFDYLRDVDLVKRHICSCMSRIIQRISPTDVQTRITRDHVMHCPSSRRPATRWMFYKADTVNRLAEEIRGKIHIEIFAADN